MAAAGCGSSHGDPGDRVTCLLDAENAAATPVVARLYAQGKFGTPAEFKARYFPNVPRRAYLDGNGRLKRRSSITGPARIDLDNLIFNHVRLTRRYGRMIEAAYARARSTAKC